MTDQDRYALRLAAAASQDCQLPLRDWVRLRAAMVERLGAELPESGGRLDAVVAQVREWQVATFGPSVPTLAIGTARHLHEEAAELLGAVKVWQVGLDAHQHLRGELADVLILLVQLCACLSVDLAEVTEAKLAELRQREYPGPDERGVWQHAEVAR